MICPGKFDEIEQGGPEARYPKIWFQPNFFLWPCGYDIWATVLTSSWVVCCCYDDADDTDLKLLLFVKLLRIIAYGWCESNANSYFLVYVTSQKITASIYISWIVYVCIKQNKTKTMSHTEFSNVLFWLTKASNTKVRAMLPHTCIRFRALNIWIQCK